MLKCSKVKGFILVETMVVIAFLATTLLTVYSAFTTVLDNVKTRIFYDDPIYLYRTYYFLSFLGKNNLTEFIDTKFANTSGTDNRSLSIVEFGCNALSVTEASGGASSTGFCESLKSSMDINHVFFMHYDVNDVIACDEQSGSLADKTLYCQRNKALQNLSISAVNYLYTLDGYTGSSTPEAVKASGYRIVMEFKKAKTKTYQYFDYNKSTTNKETMQETTYNYYYTTLRVPYGYNDRSDEPLDMKNAPILRKTYINDARAYKSSAYATRIKAITFNDSWSDTTGALAVWDVGVEPGTVQAYVKKSPSNNYFYDLYIEGKGHLYANPDSSFFLNGLLEVEQINNLSLFDTSYTTDMTYMFGMWGYNRYTALKSLDLSNFNTSKATNMSHMFGPNKYLTNLDLSSFNTSNVTTMYGMFSHARSLEKIDLSSFDTRNVTDMSYMFSSCLKLVDFDVNHFNTSNVKKMSGMFDLCNSLTKLDLWNFDTHNVTDMYVMFGRCQYLTSLNISSFDTSNVTYMAGMFEGCLRLTSLNLWNFDTSNVKSMNHMFSDCIRLTYLNVSSFDTSKVTDMAGMFHGLESMPSLNVLNFDTSNVTDMSAMFAECKSLKTIDLSNFDTSNVTIMGTKQRIIGYENNVISRMQILNGNYGMFEDCTSLVSLDLSNFKTDKVTTMNGMFAGCTNLVSLNIASFNTQAVTNLDVMFMNTVSLTNYQFPTFDLKNVSTMEAMFVNSKVDFVRLDKSNLKSDVNLKKFIYNNEVINVMVKSNQDKALFDSLNEPYLKVTVSAN